MVDVPKKRGRPAGVKTASARTPAKPIAAIKPARAPKAVSTPKAGIMPAPTPPVVSAPVQSPKPAPLTASPVNPEPVAAAPFQPEPVPAVKLEPEPVAAAPAGEKAAALASPAEVTEYIAKPVKKTTAATTPIELEGTNLMNDILENSKKFAEDAKVRFQGAFSEISEKAKAGVEKSTKAVEELGDIAKGNVEALVESGKIAAKGIETLGQDAAEYSRMTFEKATAAMKSIAAVKSPAEFFQLQSELLSSTFDAFAKETAKNSEAILKLAGDVAQPLSTRVSVVTEKVKSLAA